MEIYKDISTGQNQEFKKLLLDNFSKTKIEEGKLLTGKITKISEELKKIDVRLSNKSFVDRAPQNIVEQEKSNFANLEKDVKKIELTLKGL